MATEVKQRNNRVLVILGVVLAVAAGALTLFIAQRNSSSSSGGGGSSGSNVNAVYASVLIPKGTKITVDMVQVKHVSADLVSATTPSDPTAVVNKFTSIDVAAGSQLQTGFLVLDAASANTALSVQPLEIPDGHVAMAIPTSWPGGDPARSTELFSVGGLVQPDDHIDMLVDPKGDGTVRYGFQDIHVLRAGTPAAAGAAATVPAVYVIEVPRAQAEQIAFAFSLKSSTGVVKYVLRPRNAYNKGYLGIDDHGGQEQVPNINDIPVTPQTFDRLFPTH